MQITILKGYDEMYGAHRGKEEKAIWLTFNEQLIRFYTSSRFFSKHFLILVTET